MRTLSAVLLALAASAVNARCPNLCSGRGSCTVDDTCICWAGFTGPDCSLRTCPDTDAWAVDHTAGVRGPAIDRTGWLRTVVQRQVSSPSSPQPHTPTECGNRGTCDRSSGECQCFEGFTGRSCERATCPNDCSGHGKCRMVQDLPLYADPATGTTTWDERMLQACVCDGGFFGPDCSLRYCPFGDDPITQCDRDTINEQVLEVRVSSKLNLAGANLRPLYGLVGNEFQLSFRDSANTNFTTRRVAGAWGYSAVTTSIPATTLDAFTEDATSAARIEAALESLPNFAVRDVTVTHESTDVTPTEVFNTFEVTFRHLEDGQNNYGKQNLACNANNVCAGPGCQPRVRQSYFLAQWESDGDTGTGGFVGSDDLLDPLDIDLDFSGAGDAAPYLRIHADSVLACPVGGECNSENAITPMGVIMLIFEEENDKVYGKAFGSDDIDVTITAGVISAWGTNVAEPDSADATLVSGYTYLGVITTANQAKFDISAIVPNTFIQVDTLPNAVGSDVAVVLFYQPVTCTVTDVSESGSAFTNLDVENIECSGRGECDRSAGQCSCFEGYTGVACEVQTTIV